MEGRSKTKSGRELLGLAAVHLGEGKNFMALDDDGDIEGWAEVERREVLAMAHDEVVPRGRRRWKCESGRDTGVVV